jgi:TPR repeat protein
VTLFLPHFCNIVVASVHVTWRGEFAKKTFTMKIFPRVRYAAALVLAMGGVSIFGSAGLAAETFTLDTARAAASQGDPQAEFFLARRYADGIGVVRDYTKAVGYLRQAAMQGYAPAETGLGSCYAHGEGVQQDYTQAVQWYRKAAAQGDALAQYCLGYAYAHGQGESRDMNEALNWWHKAADQGQVDAQNALGQFYFHGEHTGDTNINYSEAAKWLRKAADQGFTPAMSTLGYMHLYGIGVKHDFAQALQWNRRAAQSGDPAAQDNLGQMYENGEGGLPIDLVQAYKWFWLSELQGNPFGRHDVMEIQSHNGLTPEQIAQAKRMASEFLAQMRKKLPAITMESQTESAR